MVQAQYATPVQVDPLYQNVSSCAIAVYSCASIYNSASVGLHVEIQIHV